MNVPTYVIRGAHVFDAATGESTRRDLAIAGGVVRQATDVSNPVEIDASGLHVLFGVWDCHAHPGGLMYDPCAQGYFEGAAEWAVRAGVNLMEAARMGVTGVRAVAEADRVDLAWSRAFAAGAFLGPRLLCSGAGIRTTGGHGTAFPRRSVEVEWECVADGPTEMRRAVRSLIEQGVHWIKVMLTGGLYSVHETVEDSQLSDDEFDALMDTARRRGVPVAAHCGSARIAEKFAVAGGRSVEHGYALDERAAQAMAASGTWLVPTIGVTHDEKWMSAEGWPEHARVRAHESAARHADALRACLEAGVRIATGADLNPIGPRMRAELQFLEAAGMTRQQVLYAATVGGRALNGVGEETAPVPGVAADLIFVEGDPMEDINVLFDPRGVMTYGRFVLPVSP
ncbi:MAG: amidohydrolase family protein [Actinomycetota bacterium]|nr:amidohydrolase family protein [Actinomycetota bacterium]